MSSYYNISVQKTLELLKTEWNGLAPEQIVISRSTYGSNKVTFKKQHTVLSMLWAQLSSPLVFILIFAAVFSLVMQEMVDAIIISLAVVLSTIFGFLQEWKAEQTLSALKKMATQQVRVKREGSVTTIPVDDVVVGDIVLLGEGDRVPADGRLLVANGLQVNEAALTGEAMAVEKETQTLPLTTMMPDQVNMMRRGTVVLEGNGQFAVTAVGSKTVIGEVANEIAELGETKTPLQQSIAKLAHILMILIGFVAAIIVVVGLLYGYEATTVISTAIAVGVAAVPESLLVVITVILTIGASKLFKVKALVRRLVATETLGSVTVIATDKTGTITTGHMKVADLVVGTGEKSDILVAAALANDSIIEPLNQTITGTDGTDNSILEYLLTREDETDLTNYHRQLATVQSRLPFSSKRAFTGVELAEDEVVVKGAWTVVKSLCNLSSEEINSLEKNVQTYSGQGYRVIAVARGRGTIEDNTVTGSNLSLLGFILLADPVRDTASHTVASTVSAGIKVILITGDHPATALRIARDAGIIDDSHTSYLTSLDIADYNESELRERVQEVRVFARILPIDKLRIIQALKANGEVVAMTGDGVNDAPALKAADVGIAVGSGTEVAKEASDIVLLNDNLETVVQAIAAGRTIFENVRKVTLYLLKDSLTEIILILFAIIGVLPLPLLAAAILWINIVQDALPAFAFAYEPSEQNVLEQPPRKANEGLFSTQMLYYLISLSLVGDLLLILIYWYLANSGVVAVETMRTVVFLAIGLKSLFVTFTLRSFNLSLWQSSLFNNRVMLLAVVVSAGGLFLPVLVPGIGQYLGLGPITFQLVIAVTLYGLSQAVWFEAVKCIWNCYVKKPGDILR